MKKAEKNSFDGRGTSNGTKRLDEWKPIGGDDDTHMDRINRPQKPKRQAARLSDFDMSIEDMDERKKKRFGRRKKQAIVKKKKFFTPKRVIKMLVFIAVIGGIFYAIQVYFLVGDIIVRTQGQGALALQDNIDPTQLRGEGDGRVNVLLIGVGGVGHTAGSLADTIMIVSIDPISKDVALLSIPRDFYVQIPNYGSSRINAAHTYGELYGVDGGGPALLRETVENVTGVPIHYYVRIDFEGFKAAIDAIGGITIDVPTRLYDPYYPDARLVGYEPLKIEAGEQYFDGELALKYARSRKTSSDFDRGRRQQEVISAVKNKALSISTLANPVKISQLFSSIGDHVKTDLQVNEILKLIDIAKSVDDSVIVNEVLDNGPDNYLASQNIGGAAVLVPKAGIGNYSQIQSFVRSLFVDGFIKKEQATVRILNGTGEPGFATRVGDRLKDFGYKVVSIDDADNSSYTKTVVYDSTNKLKPFTSQLLKLRFNVDHVQSAPSEYTDTDFTIILGQDYSL